MTMFFYIWLVMVLWEEINGLEMLTRPPEDRDHSIDLAVVKKITLKGIFDEESTLIWTGLICLQFGTGGGLPKM
jgi:hypothetical protein